MDSSLIPTKSPSLQNIIYINKSSSNNKFNYWPIIFIIIILIGCIVLGCYCTKKVEQGYIDIDKIVNNENENENEFENENSQ